MNFWDIMKASGLPRLYVGFYKSWSWVPGVLATFLVLITLYRDCKLQHGLTDDGQAGETFGTPNPGNGTLQWSLVIRNYLSQYFDRFVALLLALTCCWAPAYLGVSKEPDLRLLSLVGAKGYSLYDLSFHGAGLIMRALEWTAWSSWIACVLLFIVVSVKLSHASQSVEAGGAESNLASPNNTKLLLPNEVVEQRTVSIPDALSEVDAAIATLPKTEEDDEEINTSAGLKEEDKNIAGITSQATGTKEQPLKVVHE